MSKKKIFSRLQLKSWEYFFLHRYQHCKNVWGLTTCLISFFDIITSQKVGNWIRNRIVKFPAESKGEDDHPHRNKKMSDKLSATVSARDFAKSQSSDPRNNPMYRRRRRLWDDAIAVHARNFSPPDEADDWDLFARRDGKTEARRRV